MNTKIALTSFLIVSSSNLLATGAQVTIDLATDTMAQTVALAPLNSGYTARIGFYSGGALTVTSTYSDIISNWTEAGQVNFATGGDVQGVNGYFNTGGLGFSDALGIGGKQVWVFLTDGANNNALFYGAALGTFKHDADVPSSGAASITGANAGGFTYSLGSYNALATTNNPNGGGVIFLNQAVPETSSVLLGSLGALALLRRRRI